MSETITGIAVKSIERALVTDDGSHMLLTYKGNDGREATLAIPREFLQGLLMLTGQSIARIAQKRGLPPEQREVMEASSWVLNEAPDKRLVMSIRVAGGAELSFVLPMKGQQEVYNVNELLKRASEVKFQDKDQDKDKDKPTLN